MWLGPLPNELSRGLKAFCIVYFATIEGELYHLRIFLFFLISTTNSAFLWFISNYIVQEKFVLRLQFVFVPALMILKSAFTLFPLMAFLQAAITADLDFPTKMREKIIWLFRSKTWLLNCLVHLDLFIISVL